MQGRLKHSFILMTSSVWECLWTSITQSQQLRRKTSAWRIMYIPLGLLRSASKLNFAAPEWIGLFFHKEGAEGQRVGWIAEGRAQGTPPATSQGGYEGTEGWLQPVAEPLVPWPPADSSRSGRWSGFPWLFPSKVAPRLWHSFLLPFLPGSPAPCPAAHSPLPQNSPKIG